MHLHLYFYYHSSLAFIRLLSTPKNDGKRLGKQWDKLCHAPWSHWHLKVMGLDQPTIFFSCLFSNRLLWCERSYPMSSLPDRGHPDASTLFSCFSLLFATRIFTSYSLHFLNAIISCGQQFYRMHSIKRRPRICF